MIPDSLKCSICLEIYHLPIVLICGHTYCRCCIEILKKSHNKCPECRNHISCGYPCYTLKTIIENYYLTINKNDKTTVS